MKKRKVLLILLIFIVIIAIINNDKQEISNDIKTYQGNILGNKVWEGEILIKGDVIILPDSSLTIKPGTKIFFAPLDETKSKFDIEIPADGFNNDDPTRLKKYADSHSSILAVGSLIAKGTADNPIIFTSTDQKFADWGGIALLAGRSEIDYAIVEYSRNGIAVPSKRKDIVVRNTHVKDTMWGCFSIRGSNGLYENNIAENCGHEGFDVEGNARIINNRIHKSHAGIIVFGGQPTLQNNIIQDKVQVQSGNPRMIDNKIVRTLRCNKKQAWIYENYVIPCEGKPYLRN